MIDKNDIPEGFELGKTIDEHGIEQDCYVQINSVVKSNQEIGDIIIRDAFEGNPHAQIADITSGLLGLAYILVQVVGKDAVNQAIGSLRPSIEAVSDVREQQGLSRYNLSFLD